MRGPGKTQPQILRTEQRRARVLALRTAGMTYRRIADAMWADPHWRTQLPASFNARHCHEDVTVALRRQRAAFDETVELVRRVELDRLDRMTLAVWERAQRGDDRAIQTVLALMARRARLLPGLEAPFFVAPNVPGRAAHDAPLPTDEAQALVWNLAQYGLAQRANGNGRGDAPE